MDVTQIILIVFIVVLLIAYPIMMYTRNKKDNQRMQEQTNSLKRGDKVLTTSGVYGTIVDLQMDGDKKIVTIETGTEKKKGYISVDAYAIYNVMNEEEKTEAPVEEKSEVAEQKVETEVKEEKSEEIKSDSETVQQPIPAETQTKNKKRKKN